MRMPNPGDVEAAFAPYLKPDESLKHWAYGRRGPSLLVFVPLYLLGVLPGVLARALLTTSYLVGLTERRLVVLRFRGYLNVEESFAYALDQMPPVRSKRTLYTALLALDDAERPLIVRFGLFTAHNSDQHVRGILTRLERGPEEPPPAPVTLEEAMSERFIALRKDLVDALGEERTAAFLDVPTFHPKGTLAYVVFGEGYTPGRPKDGGGYVTACLVKNTVFATVFDLEAPCWFVFTESLYEGAYSAYGPIPPEAPSIWDEPGLLPQALKADATYRDIENVDPYTLNGQVYRQWALRVTPGEIGIHTLHQASARLWHVPQDHAGPRLRGYLFCLQPGLPMVYLAHVHDGACVLLTQHAGVLRPFAQQFKDWHTASSPGIAPPEANRSVEGASSKTEALRRQAIRTVQALKQENEPRIHDPFWTSPTGYNYARWADKGFRMALNLLQNTRSEKDEPDRDYLKRVAAQVRAERDAWRTDATDEDGACSGALDAALNVIYDLIPKTA